MKNIMYVTEKFGEVNFLVNETDEFYEVLIPLHMILHIAGFVDSEPTDAQVEKVNKYLIKYKVPVITVPEFEEQYIALKTFAQTQFVAARHGDHQIAKGLADAFKFLWSFMEETLMDDLAKMDCGSMIQKEEMKEHRSMIMREFDSRSKGDDVEDLMVKTIFKAITESTGRRDGKR